MKRTIFAIFALLALCLLPIAGTLADKNADAPHRTVQLQDKAFSRLN